MKRRTALLSISAGAAAAVWPAGAQEIPADVNARNDAAAESYLKSQITEVCLCLVSVPDEYGMHQPISVAGLIETLTAAVNHAGSKHHGSKDEEERKRMGARYL